MSNQPYEDANELAFNTVGSVKNLETMLEEDGSYEYLKNQYNTLPAKAEPPHPHDAFGGDDISMNWRN